MKYLIAFFLGVASVALQAGPPVTAELVGRWNECPYAYADVWGDAEYAYLCHFGDAGVDVIDIGDPFHPRQITEIRPDPPNEHASSQDVQTGDGLLFIALESNGNDGVLIVDIRNPLNPVKKTLVTIPNFADVHNVFYDNRVLYLANGRTSDVAIVDLTDYNPDNAPVRITQARWILNGVGNSFVHDITVQGGRLYACAWNSGLWVYDASSVTRRRPTLYASAAGASTHSCWPTDNGRFVVTGEERGGGGIKVFEVIPRSQTSSGTLVQRDSFVRSDAVSVHNQLMDGHRLYDAWYQAGLVVHDVDPVTGRLTYVTEYDTQIKPDRGGFSGAWGVYPYLGVDRVLVSDLQTGLFVIDVSGVPKLRLADGFPTHVHPLRETPLAARVLHSNRLAVKDPVLLHYSAGGAAWSSQVMQPAGLGEFQGILPRVPCGASVEFHISAATDDAQLLREPPQAPTVVYSLTSRTLRNVLDHEDFEASSGWSAGAPGDTASTGIWTHGNPIGTIAQPENDNPFGQGMRCWFTGQGPLRGDSHLSDVDGGITTLVSPAFDASIENAVVSYSRWFWSNGNPSAGDAMEVALSNDGGASWVILERVLQGRAAWVEKSWAVQDFLPPTQNMKLRVAVADLGADSLVEGAFDDFMVLVGLCDQRPGDRNGDGRIDLIDHQGLLDCFTGPTANAGLDCVAFDADGDADVDLADVRAIHETFDGPA